jgi:HK97 gp10 family phage protein
MREFSSLADFATHIGTLVAVEVTAEHRALGRAAALIQNAAKAKIGDYQEAAGDFAAWAELAESTKADRVQQGYSENDPLLRSGDLRDSIERHVEPGEASVGSNSDIAVFQELGTAKIPPRSFLGGAAVENAERVVEIIGRDVVIALVGEDVFGGAIDIETP